MARGFKTGGRQKGTPNKATLWKRARAQEGLRLADERGVTPLDIMLSFMRGEGKYTREEYRAARDAAPLRHEVRAKAKDPLREGQDYLYSAGDRPKATKLVLEFTKAKPAAKNEVTLEGFAKGGIACLLFSIEALGGKLAHVYVIGNARAPWDRRNHQ